MNKLTTTTFALLLTAAAAPAQDLLFFEYGVLGWGGRVSLTGDADFARGGTLFAPTLSADLRTALNKRIRLNGVEREAFHAQGTLAADASGQLTSINGSLRLVYSESVALEGLVRVGGAVVFRQTFANELTRTIDLAPLNVYLNGDVQFTVPVGPFTLTLGAGATADVDLSLTPQFTAPNLASLTANADAQVQGRSYVSVGVPGVLAFGVRSLLDLADPVASATAATDFRTVSGQLCWSMGNIVLRVIAFVDTLVGELSTTVVNATMAGTSGCRNLF